MGIENINWYPGHMKKTRELIEKNLKLVDIVIEVCDARIPESSRNPIISEITARKPRIIVLGKRDLADENATKLWLGHFGDNSIALNNASGDGLKRLLAMLQTKQEEVSATRNMYKPLRIMIVGVPNSGKSSLINRLTGKKSTQTGDRPGVTRGKQWLTIASGMQLLDTPGILWPKFEDPHVGLNLAFCGSIRDEIMDISELALMFLKEIAPSYIDLLLSRYGITEDDLLETEYDGDTEVSQFLENQLYKNMSNEIALALFDLISRKRGFIKKGNTVDYERAGRTILDEFRAGKLGRITLERP
jgi:ribosome biogenesis GTPase A